MRSNAELMRAASATSTSTCAPSDLHRGQVDPDELRKLFDFLEFHSLAERLGEAFGERLAGTAPEVGVLEAEVTELDRPGAEAVALLRRAGRVPTAAWPWPAPGTGGDDDRTPLVGLAFVRDAGQADVV